MRDVTEAHFLHERSGLQAVVRPPVKFPTALAWVPGREILLIGTRSGEIFSFDPVLGTRLVAENIGEPAKLAVHEDRKTWMCIARGGAWMVGEIGGGITATGKHGFLGGMSASFLKEHVVMAGDEVDGRVLLVAKGAEVKMRARVPERVVPFPDEDGKGLMLGRSTPAGLVVVRLAKGERFPKDTSTVHRLSWTGDRVLGITPTGVCVWTREGGNIERSMRLPDLTVGDVSKDGRYFGLGTRSGAVALARMDEKEKLIHPDLVKAFDGPVTSVAFSTRGRWLATGGVETVQLWSWEE